MVDRQLVDKLKDNSENSELKLWTPGFIFLILINTLQGIGFTMLGPTLPKYVLEIGASLAVAGFVAGIFAFTALVARPFGGAASDRIDKRKLLIVTNVIMGIAVLGYSFSVSVPALIFFRILQGAAFAVNSTANNAWAASLVPEKRLGEGIGYLSISYILAQAIGPGIGLYVSEGFGYKTMFLLSLALLLLATIMLFGIKGRQGKRAEAEKLLKKGKLKFGELIAKEGLIFAALTALISMLNGQLSSFIALIGEERGITGISLFFTVSAVTLLVSRPLAGRLSDRYSLSYFVYPAFIIAAVAAVMIGSAVTLPVMLLAGFIISAGSGGLMPALQANCIKKLGAGRTGLAVSTYMIGADVGNGLGPILGGAVSGSFGYGKMLYLSAAIMPLGLIIYYIYTKQERRKQANGCT